MPFNKKTYEELVEIELAEVQGRNPELDISAGSDAEINARAHAIPVHLTQANAEFLANQALASKAEDAFLLQHADDKGVNVASAAQADGFVALFASNAQTQPSGTTLSHITGKTYKTTKTVTTGQAKFSTAPAKTVGGQATNLRIPVLPDVSLMLPNDAIQIGAEKRIIKEVIPHISSVEVYDAFDAVPVAGTPITAPFAAFAPVLSDEEGSDQNQLPGTLLAVAGPVGTIEANAVVQELSGGGNDATIDEVRRDVLAASAVRPGSGNEQHYRVTAKETPGVRIEDAFVYRNVWGANCTYVLPFGVSGARYTGKKVNDKIRAHLASVMPFPFYLVVDSWRPLYPAVDVQVKVRPNVGYEEDWIQTLTLSSSGHTTTSMEMSGFASQVEVGDRVVAEVSLTKGRVITEERVVVSNTRVGSITTIRIDPATPFSGLPVASSVLRPGGPLWTPIYDAISDIFDRLGPGDTDNEKSVGQTEYETRWPRVGEAWPAALYPDAIASAIRAVPGVFEIQNVSPAHGSPRIPPPMYRLQLGKVVVEWL